MLPAPDRWPLFLTLLAHGELTDQQRAALWFVRCLGEPYERAARLLPLPEPMPARRYVSRHTLHRRLVEGEQLLAPLR